jgi:hypothetical protein
MHVLASLFQPVWARRTSAASNDAVSESVDISDYSVSRTTVSGQSSRLSDTSHRSYDDALYFLVRPTPALHGWSMNGS